MFKKFLASVGIGKAKVDAILLTEHFRPGEDFQVEVQIKGGDVEQELNGLELAIMTSAKAEAEVGDDEVTYNKSVVLQHWHQELNLVIAPGEEISKTFTLTLHPETPITAVGYNNQAKVWLQTGLDIKNGIDGSDKDGLAVLPTDTQMAILQAVEDLGYSLFKADVESGHLQGHGFGSILPCYQEFEFKPQSSSFFGTKEIEVSMINDGHQTGVLIELDRAFIGDSYKSVVVPNTVISPEQAAQYLRRILD